MAHDHGDGEPDLASAAREMAARRSLFTYLTVEAADEYMAVMRLFTETLLADLSAAEVASRLAERGLDLDTDAVESRCAQLVVWGNLVRSVRETRVRTVAAYHRSRSRYQVSKLGGRLHREAEEILRTVDGAREVARELLARISDTLRIILLQVSYDRVPVDAESLAGQVTGVFNDHRLFQESVTDFYAYLAGVLTRYDLAGEEYAQFKDLLLDYVDLIGADVARNAPEILNRLKTLLTPPLIDTLLANLPAPPTAGDRLIVVERLPGRTLADWEQLAAWYGASDQRSGPEQLRVAARQALGQLIANAKRMLTASGTGVSRRADLLRLAGWFHGADGETAHRMFDAAFGAFPARHLLLGPEEQDLRAGPSTSWWVAAPVDVPVSLRERGDRTARGRASRVPDAKAQTERLEAQAQERTRAREMAAAELLAAGGLHGSHLSRAARDLLLELVPALFTTAAGGHEEADHPVSDLGLTLWGAPDPGSQTVINGDDGVLTIEGLLLWALPLGEDFERARKAVNS
ncbi:DUF2397 domain-containing protein [Pseudofrankia inefficax]|uniref:TIGR02677 family protein n=1 Tax=Pseudofrankia inefficax (strain DSM 45817 / CECT 9037 / DDB 130130 / EuI1c) TaxID=298654 RepID=E3J1D1_PSEI1|nr:DUF2397 domain-containing protein [Pseudofrankia inefficax]ADP80452.1 Conserved hypothetical protein CHP02677 [Pseudofrankia inefficax]